MKNKSVTPIDSIYRVYIKQPKFASDGSVWHPSHYQEFSSELGAKLYALMYSYIPGVDIVIHSIYHVNF